jgi:hypothetical protein
MTRTATPGQISYIISLCESRQIDMDSYHGVELDENFPFSLVTSVLDYLKSLPRPIRPAASAAELTEGMYQTPDGQIYKVQAALHGSGKPYAKRLETETVDGPEGPQTDVWFEFAPGAIRTLRPEHKMSLEAAKAFGALYGICCVCATALTDEVSIAEGIGPICGGRSGSATQKARFQLRFAA